MRIATLMQRNLVATYTQAHIRLHEKRQAEKTSGKVVGKIAQIPS